MVPPPAVITTSAAVEGLQTIARPRGGPHFLRNFVRFLTRQDLTMVPRVWSDAGYTGDTLLERRQAISLAIK
jgi:hypothetical protein